jgi:hypothetical protein
MPAKVMVPLIPNAANRYPSSVNEIFSECQLLRQIP